MNDTIEFYSNGWFQKAYGEQWNWVLYDPIPPDARTGSIKVVHGNHTIHLPPNWLFV